MVPHPSTGGAGHMVGAASGSPSAAQGASSLRRELEARTRRIIERPAAGPDPAAMEREKIVVRECRYLMRLLATRRRSAGEMRERLDRREVPAALAHEVMARMDRAGLIDDAGFARDWVQQRRAMRSLGDAALRRELERRHVDERLVDAALGAEESDEELRCRELVRSRIGPDDAERLRAERDGSHRRRLSRRLDALLTRKGYPGDLAVHVISGELRAAAEESVG
ncbi:regulatory protein RecX [Brachybacterium sp. YJGR34]|uniref:regulatory protein RecX n=1 Tax=Brachybacterium sp. YJGR34 TaxID=2059911 RepID=UPI0013003EFD|nr:regulatory protein RecX [Brachybacterium sp. YJGR34]